MTDPDHFDRSLPLAWARLLRIPNVFSAAADILLGFWIVHANAEPGPTASLGLLVLASCLLYSAGMVWNDLFDLDVDRRERPTRPLPSGSVSLRAAVTAGWLLIGSGLLCALGAGIVSSLIALALVAAIFAYDGWLKRTPVGPLGMGLCRSLNVLLGMSPALAITGSAGAARVGNPWLWLVPLANGIYIVGVTWFARHEATTSSRRGLAAAACVMATGLGLHAIVLAEIPQIDRLAWPAGALFVVLLGARLAAAIRRPEPIPVQKAVKAGVLGLVPLDAILVLAFCGPLMGLAVLALLPPALVLGKWVYST